MDPFYNIWNAATFKRSSCGSNIVVIVGLISMMIFGACTATKMMLCSQTESMPCVLRYRETKVCPGDGVYTNTTLRVDPNIIPQNVSILWQGSQFSKGPVVSGPFHNGDEHIDRWINKISFQGNTMTFKIVNLEIKSVDEFECHMEIDIEGEKFISDHFIWFDVHSDNCPTNPPSIKDTLEQCLHNITKKLDQLIVLYMNSSASDMAERLNINFKHWLSQLANNITEGSIQRAVMHEGQEDVKTKLDTQNKMHIAQIIVLVLVLIISLFITAKIFITPRVQKGLQNKLPSSSTSDDSKVPSQSSSSLASRNRESSPNEEANSLQVSNTGEGSTPSNHTYMYLNSTARPQSMPSPEDELHYEEEPLMFKPTDT